MEDIAGSVLPKFSSSDQVKLNMALDFIGINHYTSYYVQDCINSSCEPCTNIVQKEKESPLENLCLYVKY